MNTRQRGCLTFLIMVVVGVVFCGLFPFVILPNAGIGMALPVIEVPGEVLVEDAILGMNLTNTLVATVLADIVILIFVFLAWRASKGWTNEVPGRFQGWVEFLLGGFYSFMKGIGGERLRTAPFLWPLVATIFLLLLTGNWMKLLPGVESVGKLHCAHVGKSGYPVVEGAVEGTAILYVDAPLYGGEPQTEETEEACHHFFEGEFGRYADETPEQITTSLEAAEVAVNDARIELDNLTTSLPPAAERSAEQTAQYEEALARLEAAEHEVERQHIRLENAEEIPVLVDELAVIDREIAALTAESVEEGEHAEETEPAAAEEGEAAEEVSAETQLAELQSRRDEVVAALNMARTQVQYPTATIPLSQEDLDRGVLPFIFHITPYVRGLATDLSLTIFLAIMAIVAVQIYGVWAQGPAYFEKFVNVTALGNLGKKPMGAIDFLVGLIEIISEIGKIVSLAFRLFGNLFAGGVALMAITFLVSLLVPGVIYLLEIIIGSVQALVFAVLTLVFAVQAMEAHHGDEHPAEEH